MPTSDTVGLAVFDPDNILVEFGPAQLNTVLLDVLVPIKLVVFVPQAIVPVAPALTP